MRKLRELLALTLRKLDQEKSPPELPVGLNSGLKDLDALISGLRPGTVTAVVGKRGIGSSALALQWALSAAKQGGKGVAIYSNEMTYSEISMRMLAMDGGIPQKKLRSKDLSREELIALSKSVQWLSNLEIYISDDPLVNIPSMREYLQYLSEKENLGLIVIDPLVIVGVTEDPDEELSLKRVKELKQLALDFDVPVLLTWPVPFKTKTRPPVREDLCLGLRFVADTICFIHRDDYYELENVEKGKASISVSKKGEATQSSVSLRWIGGQQKYEDW